MSAVRQRITNAFHGYKRANLDQEAAMSQAHKNASRRPPTVSTPTPAAHDTTLVDQMDELLDEIDQVLEDNVLETLRQFRQRGGQ